jgi:hypothetical protein
MKRVEFSITTTHTPQLCSLKHAYREGESRGAHLIMIVKQAVDLFGKF